MFSAESSRSQASRGGAEDLPPRDKVRAVEDPSNCPHVRAVDHYLLHLPPTREQFPDIQQNYAAIQCQVDDLVSTWSAEQRAQVIEDELE